jgi:hypothetical protein
MMRPAAVPALLVVLGTLVLPSLATADALDIPAAVPPRFRALVRARLHMPPPRHPFESRIELKAQHGYEVAVVGEGDVVAVEVIRTKPKAKQGLLEKLFGPKQAVTAYVARGTVTPRRIAAGFGKLGEIDMRFQPSGGVVKSGSHRRCRGTDHFTSRLGVFVGGLRFSGEKHYIAFDSHRAKGRVRSPLRLHCASAAFRRRTETRARPVRRHPSFAPAFLLSSSRHGVSSVELTTLRVGARTLFLAITEEGLSSMARIRYALAIAPTKKSFALNDAVTAATITPPLPFHARGSYSAAPDGTTSWTGPLSVSFPGAPRLPLAGEEFTATLEVGF